MGKKISLGGKTYVIESTVIVRGDEWHAVRGPRGAEYYLIGMGGKWLLCDARTVATIEQFDAADFSISEAA